MPKTITLQLKDDVYNAFLEAALAENRPVSNLIETAAISKIREQQFTDDVEMAEVLADRKLVKHIRQGSREAQLRYRIGAWRFFYEIDEEEKVAFMIAASHRSAY